MTGRQKRWAVRVVALGILAVAVWLFLRSHELSAEERAYAGTWYAIYSNVLLVSEATLQDDRLVAFESLTLPSIRGRAGGGVVRLLYTFETNPILTRLYMRGQGIVYPESHTMTAAGPPEGPLKFAHAVGPIELYRTLADADAAVARRLAESTSPTPQF